MNCHNKREKGPCPTASAVSQQGAALHPAGLCSPAPASTPRPEGSAGKGFPFPCFIGLSVSLSQGCASPVCSLSSPCGLRYRIPPLTPLPLRKCSLQHSLLVPEAQGGPRGGWKPIPGESSKKNELAERLRVYDGWADGLGQRPLVPSARPTNNPQGKQSRVGGGIPEPAGRGYAHPRRSPCPLTAQPVERYLKR